MTEKIIVKVKKLHPNAKLPTKATDGSACWDVYSLKDIWTEGSRVTYLIHTGIALEVPKGYFIDIRPRSGLATKGFIVCNSPGTLDPDYRGELIIIGSSRDIINVNIKAGDRIAQIRVEKVWDTEFIEVESLSETERGKGGLGSTGR